MRLGYKLTSKNSKFCGKVIWKDLYQHTLAKNNHRIKLGYFLWIWNTLKVLQHFFKLNPIRPISGLSKLDTMHSCTTRGYKTLGGQCWRSKNDTDIFLEPYILLCLCRLADMCKAILTFHSFHKNSKSLFWGPKSERSTIFVVHSEFIWWVVHLNRQFWFQYQTGFVTKRVHATVFPILKIKPLDCDTSMITKEQSNGYCLLASLAGIHGLKWT